MTTPRPPWRSPAADATRARTAAIRALVCRLLVEGADDRAGLAKAADALTQAALDAGLDAGADDKRIRSLVARWHQERAEAAWGRVRARCRVMAEGARR